MIYEFYTFSKHNKDLHIHTWEYSHRNDDGLDVYYCEAHDKETTVVPYDNEDEFAKENDVFLNIIDIVLDETPVFEIDLVDWDTDE